MPYDYSQIYAIDGVSKATWEDIYDHSESLPQNLLKILQQVVFLPHDHYKIVAAYFMLPSALCKVVPYLFFYGQSGSGKTTLAKFCSYLHNVDISSPADTFAGIRNTLNSRKKGYIEVIPSNPEQLSFMKEVEKNTFMVWEDIDAHNFVSNPDIYRLFKFGYDRSTDKISISSSEAGTNLEFKCFCPKVFSSITPIHLDNRFKELARRLITIPCQRLEDLSEQRRYELDIDNDNWRHKLLDLEAYDWEGINKMFDEYWNIDRAKDFLQVGRSIQSSARGLTSTQRVISLDLLATGIIGGIWAGIEEATADLKSYWQWTKEDSEVSGEFVELFRQFIKQEERNAINGNIELSITSNQIKAVVDNWLDQGWLMEKPKPKEIKEVLLEIGLRFHKGVWFKKW